jgi:hypothetical protein
MKAEVNAPTPINQWIRIIATTNEHMLEQLIAIDVSFLLKFIDGRSFTPIINLVSQNMKKVLYRWRSYNQLIISDSNIIKPIAVIIFYR